MVPAGLQGSLCVFAIWGNETFRDPTDYAGPFKSISGTFKHIKGFVAECSSCVAIGVGYDTQLVGCGFSETMYWTLVEHVDDVFDELARTLQGIVENAKGQFSGNF